jgi:hypothetical protein
VQIVGLIIYISRSIARYNNENIQFRCSLLDVSNIVTWFMRNSNGWAQEESVNEGRLYETHKFIYIYIRLPRSLPPYEFRPVAKKSSLPAPFLGSCRKFPEFSAVR